MRASFRAIRDEMARRIAERAWGPGALIPGEEELAREFGAARATVNRALQELARSGLIERKRKAGTRVALHPVREARFVIPLVRQEIEARGGEYRYRLLDVEEKPAPEAVYTRLNLPAAAPLLHVRCLHLSDGSAYQLEDRWINLGAVPSAREADFGETSPNEWLVRNSPFTDAEFTFLAAAANLQEATLLDLREGDPVFVGERITWLHDRPITLVRMTHPASHRMISRM